MLRKSENMDCYDEMEKHQVVELLKSPGMFEKRHASFTIEKRLSGESRAVQSDIPDA